MPFIRIQTNLNVKQEIQVLLMSDLSKITSKLLSKSEQYIMLQFQENQQLLLAGDAQNCAFLQLKSISLPQQQVNPLSDAYCTSVNQHLDIINERIYIEFANVDRSMWGWNRGTF